MAGNENFEQMVLNLYTSRQCDEARQEPMVSRGHNDDGGNCMRAATAIHDSRMINLEDFAKYSLDISENTYKSLVQNYPKNIALVSYIIFDF